MFKLTKSYFQSAKKTMHANSFFTVKEDDEVMGIYKRLKRENIKGLNEFLDTCPGSVENLLSSK